MKNKKLLISSILFLFSFIFVNLVSAQVGMNNPLLPRITPSPGTQALTINNNTLNVNSSNCWQSYCNPNIYLPYAYNHTSIILDDILRTNTWYTTNLVYGDYYWVNSNVVQGGWYQFSSDSYIFFSDNTSPFASNGGLFLRYPIGYDGGIAEPILEFPRIVNSTKEWLVGGRTSQTIMGQNNFTNNNNFSANNFFNGTFSGDGTRITGLIKDSGDQGTGDYQFNGTVASSVADGAVGLSLKNSSGTNVFYFVPKLLGLYNVGLCVAPCGIAPSGLDAGYFFDGIGGVSTAGTWTFGTLVSTTITTTNLNVLNSLNTASLNVTNNASIRKLDVINNATFQLQTINLANVTTVPCNGGNAGGVYYDGNLRKHYGCNSTTWNALY